MKHLMLALTTTLLATSMPQSDDGLRLRYRDLSGPVALTVRHEIEIRADHVIEAGREFSFDLALATDPWSSTVLVTIERARGTSVAHDTTQRLGTRHLTGREFPLSIGDAGRELDSAESPDPPLIDLGPMVSGGFPVAEVLADSLPPLPETAVAVGTNWTTERRVRSLQGWNWGTGRLSSRHRVSAIDRRDDHSVVSVETEARAELGSVEGERAYTGELRQTLSWTFDATDGRLLTLSMEQETEGLAAMGQGELPIRQRARVEIGPRP